MLTRSVLNCELCRDFQDEDPDVYIETDSASQTLRNSSNNGCNGCYNYFIKDCRGSRGYGHVCIGLPSDENKSPQ